MSWALDVNCPLWFTLWLLTRSSIWDWLIAGLRRWNMPSRWRRHVQVWEPLNCIMKLYQEQRCRLGNCLTSGIIGWFGDLSENNPWCVNKQKSEANVPSCRLDWTLTKWSKNSGCFVELPSHPSQNDIWMINFRKAWIYGKVL